MPTAWLDLPGAVDVPQIENVSAGGMPDRVKCLHVVMAHSLAKGPGLNPFGDEALALLAVEPAMAGILDPKVWV